MKLVMTLVVRDEADIVDAQIAYHLNAGVDFVIATDHDSQDGTTEILESYEREGSLHLIRERGEMRESRWRTHMARLAATVHGADWVINTDADEFWLPRGGTLEEVLAAVPESFGVVCGSHAPLRPPPDDARSFAERMTVRVSPRAALNDPTGPYRPHAKAAHRADPDIVVRFGSHLVSSSRLVPLRDWYPADVFHFPFRSLEQYERKNIRRAHGDKPLGQYVKGFEAREHGRLEQLYLSIVVNDEMLERGRKAGSLVVDTRLRDALRDPAAPRASSPHFELAGEEPVAVDASALREADLVRLQRRLDGLSARLGDGESRRWPGLIRRLSRTRDRS